MKDNKQSSFRAKPVMAIISDDIRRDLHDPLKYFCKIKIIHLYRLARYHDMKPQEFTNTVQYNSPGDLLEKLKAIKPDIIQGPEPYASRQALRNCFVVLKYHKKYKVPFVFPVFENRPAKIKFGPIVGVFMRWALGYYGHYAQKIIALNLGAQDNLLEASVNKNKIIRMCWGTWGIDPTEFHSVTGSSIIEREKNKKPIILFVGKVEEQKGILDLLEAFRKLRQKNSHIQLNVIGSGSLVDKIKNEPGVKYIGTVKNKDIPKYFQEATVTCVPSKTTKIWAEQVGMVNIQSIACGTPVVSTFSGAIGEYLPNNRAALLVPEDNVKALTNALYKVVTDDNFRKELSKKSLKFVLSHYDAKNNIFLAEKLIIGLLKDVKKNY